MVKTSSLDSLNQLNEERECGNTSRNSLQSYSVPTSNQVLNQPVTKTSNFSVKSQDSVAVLSLSVLTVIYYYYLYFVKL